MEAGLQLLGKSLLVLNSRFTVVANNIANSVTDRYKNDTLTTRSFNECYIQEQANSKKEKFYNLNIYTNFGQGELYESKQNDFALENSGFIQVLNNNKVCYSRGGSFDINSEGFLVDQHGSYILGTKGNIFADGSNIEISPKGDVTVDGLYIDRVEVVDFANYEELSKSEKDYYTASQAAVTIPNQTIIKQGYSEKSNVSLTEEYLKMMEISKKFETSQAVIQILDELNGKAINSIAMF